MVKIHCTAIVDPKAELGEGVEVGPFSYIEPGVQIGDGTCIDSHVTIKTGTTIGINNSIAHGAVLGCMPQDKKHTNHPTYLNIGDNNLIREYVTISRATQEEQSTIVGNDCFIMTYAHVGHDCVLGNHLIITNNVGISGHVHIEDFVNIGGLTGIHQYVHIGRLAMIGGMSRIVRDVPPYMIVEGHDQTVYGINAIGLRRQGISMKARTELQKACKIMFRSQLCLSNAVEIIHKDIELTPEVQHLLQFAQRLYNGKNGRSRQK